MADYRLTSTDDVIRTADSAVIPSDEGNIDRLTYQQWLKDGGVPTPYVPPPEVQSQSPYVTQEQFASLQKQVDGLTKMLQK
jgi:hypothetical protein